MGAHTYFGTTRQNKTMGTVNSSCVVENRVDVTQTLAMEVAQSSLIIEMDDRLPIDAQVLPNALLAFEGVVEIQDPPGAQHPKTVPQYAHPEEQCVGVKVFLTIFTPSWDPDGYPELDDDTVITHEKLVEVMGDVIDEYKEQCCIKITVENDDDSNIVPTGAHYNIATQGAQKASAERAAVMVQQANPDSPVTNEDGKTIDIFVLRDLEADGGQNRPGYYKQVPEDAPHKGAIFIGCDHIDDTGELTVTLMHELGHALGHVTPFVESSHVNDNSVMDDPDTTIQMSHEQCRLFRRIHKELLTPLFEAGEPVICHPNPLHGS